MTGYKKVFVDTAPFIYYLERNPFYCNKMINFWAECYQEKIELVTSAVTVEEYCVYPYRKDELELVMKFDSFIEDMDIGVSAIDENIAKKAAKIRAQYKDFKAMDALQLASACRQGCDLFLTNDKQLRQFEEIKCITVDEL